MDEFANMSDEELEAYVYGNRESDRQATLALPVTHPRAFSRQPDVLALAMRQSAQRAAQYLRQNSGSLQYLQAFARSASEGALLRQWRWRNKESLSANGQGHRLLVEARPGVTVGEGRVTFRQVGRSAAAPAAEATKRVAAKHQAIADARALFTPPTL